MADMVLAASSEQPTSRIRVVGAYQHFLKMRGAYTFSPCAHSWSLTTHATVWDELWKQPLTPECASLVYQLLHKGNVVDEFLVHKRKISESSRTTCAFCGQAMNGPSHWFGWAAGQCSVVKAVADSTNIQLLSLQHIVNHFNSPAVLRSCRFIAAVFLSSSARRGYGTICDISHNYRLQLPAADKQWHAQVSLRLQSPPTAGARVPALSNRRPGFQIFSAVPFDPPPIRGRMYGVFQRARLRALLAEHSERPTDVDVLRRLKAELYDPRGVKRYLALEDVTDSPAAKRPRINVDKSGTSMQYWSELDVDTALMYSNALSRTDVVDVDGNIGNCPIVTDTDT
jgi:hypothetical protein